MGRRAVASGMADDGEGQVGDDVSKNGDLAKTRRELDVCRPDLGFDE